VVAAVLVEGGLVVLRVLVSVTVLDGAGMVEGEIVAF
jgi:hypothetical protein